jgi:hypothetical protein
MGVQMYTHYFWEKAYIASCNLQIQQHAKYFNEKLDLNCHFNEIGTPII